MDKQYDVILILNVHGSVETCVDFDGNATDCGILPKEDYPFDLLSSAPPGICTHPSDDFIKKVN